MTEIQPLSYRTTRALAVIDRRRRRELEDLAADPALHAAVCGELSQFEEIEEVPPKAPLPACAGTVCVTAWNLERCKFPGPSAALLERSGGDIHLLSEMDYGMARSGQEHTTRELARRTGCGYLFGVEWLELNIGDESERVLFGQSSNDVGFHGNAILSRLPWKRPALIRLEKDGFWFDPARGERRVGGRMALCATFEVAGRDVTCVSVHLESHSDPELRARQMGALLDGVEAYGPGAPAVIGGDLNTTSLARRHINRKDPGAPAVSPPELLDEDPERLVAPVSYEPLFELAAGAGFDWRACNRLGLPTQRTRADGTPPPPLGKLDWFLTRGLVAGDPRNVAAVDPNGGAPISDHDLLAVTLAP